MRAWLKVVAGGVVGTLMAAGVGWAGISMSDPGLPKVTLWGRTCDGRALSGMCIECHSENPSAHTPPTSFPFGESEGLYRGTHFVRNALSGSDALTNPVNAGRWQALGPWPNGALSRYGNESACASVTGTTGEMLCESCHNIVLNNDSRMLMGSYDASTGDDTLCTTCHADITGATHHPMGNVNNADSPTVRNPPINPGKTYGVTYFTAPNKITCLSCHRVHDALTVTGARILRRGASQVSTIPGVFEKSVNVVYYTDKPDPGKNPGDILARSATGVDRQEDMSPTTLRLVANPDPLCDACHKLND